jgi:hypothetical protein
MARAKYQLWLPIHTVVVLATSITADGSLFLWHFKNTTNSWHESARIAIREATQHWVRVSSDKSSNG